MVPELYCCTGSDWYWSCTAGLGVLGTGAVCWTECAG